MSSDDDVAEGETTNNEESAPRLLCGGDQRRAILEALEPLHVAGNPLVLHEVIRRSQEYGLPLPEWAASALMDQEVSLLNDPKRGKMGRYKQSLKLHVRQKTYRSIMSWLKDPRRYSSMPRSIIEKWYAGEIKHKDKKSNVKLSERALDLSVLALDGTFARTNISRLEETIYLNPIKPQLNKDLDRAEAFRKSNGLEPLDDRERQKFEDNLWERVEEIWLFDKWDVEAKVGLLAEFFGPPAPPPPNIQAELDKLGKNQSDGGVFSEE